MTEAPVVGAMTSSGCDIRVRTDGAASVAVQYADNNSFTGLVTTAQVATVAADDYTATVSLSGLAADDVYWFQVLVDGAVQTTSYVHKFRTFPAGSATFTFATLADVAPRDNVARAYRQAKDDGALFAIQLGDLDHRNPATLTEMRAMHRDMKDGTLLHGNDFVQNVLSKMAVVHVWDDHDYGGNDTDRTFAGRADAWKAFDEHWPTYPRPDASAGLWHSFTIGDAEFFVMDLRSQRDPNVQVDDANKSMLGASQKAWLKVGLLASTATWKFLVSSVTMNPTVRPTANDAWRDFSTERDELKQHIDDNGITGVIVLSGDIHTGGAIDDGTYSALGVPELSTPHTNLASGNTTNIGTWSEGVTPGAKGYGLVTVSAGSVVLEAYGANGVRRHVLTVQ
jgi:alkaline phosphatase D